MAIRGPKPIPQGLRVLRGREHTKQRETLNVEPVEDTRAAELLDLSLPESVLKRARKSLSALLKYKVFAECDFAAFERYCQHLRMAHEANQILLKEGVLSIDHNGNPHKHPAVQVYRDNSLAALRYEEQFGLTPSARMRLSKTDEQKQEDDYAQYRRRGAASSA